MADYLRQLTGGTVATSPGQGSDASRNRRTPQGQASRCRCPSSAAGAIRSETAKGTRKVTGSHDQLPTNQRRPGVRALDKRDRTRLILPG
jgi:hypothetical protein